MKNFRTYQISKEFYKKVAGTEWPSHLRDQALRAASSIVLNIAEGAGLPSKKQKARHYHIAMGSLREVQAAIEINKDTNTKDLESIADSLAAHLYKLCQKVAN